MRCTCQESQGARRVHRGWERHPARVHRGRLGAAYRPLHRPHEAAAAGLGREGAARRGGRRRRRRRRAVVAGLEVAREEVPLRLEPRRRHRQRVGGRGRAELAARRAAAARGKDAEGGRPRGDGAAGRGEELEQLEVRPAEAARAEEDVVVEALVLAATGARRGGTQTRVSGTARQGGREEAVLSVFEGVRVSGTARHGGRRPVYQWSRACA